MSAAAIIRNFKNLFDVTWGTPSNGAVPTWNATSEKLEMVVPASNHTHAASDIVSGTLSVLRGGTGTATIAAGDLLYGSAANTLSTLAGNGTATTKVLRMVVGVPTWMDFTAANLNDAVTLPRLASDNTFSGSNSFTASTVTIDRSAVANSLEPIARFKHQFAPLRDAGNAIINAGGEFYHDETQAVRFNSHDQLVNFHGYHAYNGSNNLIVRTGLQHETGYLTSPGGSEVNTEWYYLQQRAGLGPNSQCRHFFHGHNQETGENGAWTYCIGGTFNIVKFDNTQVNSWGLTLVSVDSTTNRVNIANASTRIGGGVSIGSTFYNTTPPTDGAIILGRVGIGLDAASPNRLLSVCLNGNGVIAGFGANGVQDLITVAYNSSSESVITGSSYGSTVLAAGSGRDIILRTSGGSVTIPAGTLTASKPLTITQTWNNAGVTFNPLLVNVTDTASAAASLLADFQVAGTSKCKVDKAGTITLASSVVAGGVVVAGTQLRCTNGVNTNSTTPLKIQSIAIGGTSSSTQAFIGGYTNAASAATHTVLELSPTYNQTGTAGSTDIKIVRTEMALGSGAHAFIDCYYGALGTTQGFVVRPKGYGGGGAYPGMSLPVDGSYFVMCNTAIVDAGGGFTIASDGNGALNLRKTGNNGATAGIVIGTSNARTNTSGTVNTAKVDSVYNQASGTGCINTDLQITRTETSLGSSPGKQRFFNCTQGSTDRFWVYNDGRMVASSPNSAIADASLNNGMFSFYANEAGDQLVVKVKYSGGTVKTGTVTLS